MCTPSVAFDVPGLRDSIIDGKTGIIDKKNSKSSMASEIVDLLNNKNRYQKMKNKAKEWGKEFSWNEATDKSINLINKILSGTN